MKKLILLLLLFTLSCEKQGPSDSGTEVSTESSTPRDSTIPGGINTTPSLPVSPITPVSSDAWTEEFMELINNHRTSIGLRALILDDGLSEIVLEHSKNMASGTTAFGHTGFSSRCSAGYEVLGGGNWCGENVAMGQKTPQAAYTAWMNSSGHRANIESTKATHTGFAYAKSSSGTYYWTQIFIQR